MPSLIIQRLKADKKMRLAAIGLSLLLLVYIVLRISVAGRLFQTPTSMVCYAADGSLYAARIAWDGQWRFAETDNVTDKYEACLTTFEDRRFRYHPGIDIVALTRAVRNNMDAANATQGGSTITMQVARMAMGNKERTLWQKAKEALLALAIETKYSKDDILALYASHAPFGGNVVGIDAAAWRYFGRTPDNLSWAENALLAVLPNSPALINIGRNRERLLEKRNSLLGALHNKGIIDTLEYNLATAEPLPEQRYDFNAHGPHLTDRVQIDLDNQKTLFYREKTVCLTIDADLQRRTQAIADDYCRRYLSNHINNIGVLVADVETGAVAAYVGNNNLPASLHAENSGVDMIVAKRSTGSILKPFLYAAMLSAGETTPQALWADTPLDINGFSPQNFNHSYCGAARADEAIMRPLNVPLVRMLTAHNVGRFMADLRQLGMTTLYYPEEHYGASLILGGAESTLWDLCGMYASMARKLNSYNKKINDRQNGKGFNNVEYERDDETDDGTADGDRNEEERDDDVFGLSYEQPGKECASWVYHPVKNASATTLSPSAIWYAFEAMSGLSRPEEEAEWQQFASMKRIAWKTGTSYGGRDAWAIGVTPRHVVGVWVGNASGEGRAGMTGVGFAGPVMLDVFSLLPDDGWFEKPVEDTDPVAVCRKSGLRASANCADADTLLLPRGAGATAPCRFCRLAHLSADGQWQVNSTCESVAKIKTEARFVLPPTMEYYYRQSHADYAPLPPMRTDCVNDVNDALDIIYPEHGHTIVCPRNFEGARQKVVCRAALRRDEGALFWHLDGRYAGTTDAKHDLALDLDNGRHTLTIVDETGAEKNVTFTVK